ncbi:MAG: methyltransferase domain-containing protein [Deltaproteobacteria bacterium]|nr:methyltransferase domain-containing protein [Deltaproteobacteria bacterium]
MTDKKKKPNTVRLQNISYGHKAAATLKAAIELDLFTKVSEGASGFLPASQALGITPLNAERLMVACASIGLLEKREDGYRNAPDVERFLVKGKSSYVGPWLIYTAHDFEQWKDLKGFLSADSPPSRLGLYEGMTDDMAREYHEATYSVGLGAGFLFSKQVDMSNRTLILDLGGGSGAYCIAAAQRYPRLKAIVMDFEPVTKMSQEFIAQWGMQDRISTLAGDFTTDPFPQGPDVIIQASNLPQYDQENLEKVLKKGFDTLLPGGEYHVVGETVSNDKAEGFGPALWGLHEALFGSLGRAHSEEEVTAYMRNVGFTDVAVHPFIPGSLTRITGYKPK